MAMRTSGGFSSGRQRRLLVPLSFLAATAVMVSISIFFMHTPEGFNDGVNYAIDSVCQLASAIFVLRYMRRETGILRLRWMMFGGALVLFAIVYAIASMIGFEVLPGPTVQSAEILTSATAYALLLLCATFLFSRSSRIMAFLDTLQALLFATLRYGVIYSPRTHTHFTDSHMNISIWTPILLFLLVRIAAIGAASQGELRLLRTLSIYLGLMAFTTLILNQLCYVWLHVHYGSLWDITPTLTDGCFCWIAFKRFGRQLPAERPAEAPVFVRNLMPSMIAFGNLLLGLLLLRYYPLQAVEAVVCTVVCYVLRTLRLQTQVNAERMRLFERNQQLEQLVTRDSLTGVGNRHALMTALAEMTRSRTRQPFALVLMDADWFKQANDQHGHLYGDTVLVAIAQVLRAAVEGISGGHCARLGGDEFAMLLPGLDADTARPLAEKVRQRVRELALKAGDRVITVSVGVTVAQFSSTLTFEALMGRADEALYRSKAQGRDRVELWREPVPHPIGLMSDHAEAV